METIKIKDVTSHLERFAPVAYQESYDNSGLLTGNPDWIVSGVLVTLDCIEEVVEEAIQLKCNLIVAHHPIIFKGLKTLTGKNYVERTIIKAIKHDIAIYTIHTNLDNVSTGVSKRFADQLGLTDQQILAPKSGSLTKMVTFIPKDSTEKVLGAIHNAGAGQLGHYKNCSFQVTGIGSFQPTDKAKPHIGESGKLEQVEEVRTEVIFATNLQSEILNALKNSHPYEEVAYYLTPLSNSNQEVGPGIIGSLPSPMKPDDFLRFLKKAMNTQCIRHTAMPFAPIQKVAVCGGAGSFLLPVAKSKGADAFVSADFKYHEFFDAEDEILIADIGHYESEQFTKDLLKEVLEENFTNFAVYFSKSVTNPISYL